MTSLVSNVRRVASDSGRHTRGTAGRCKPDRSERDGGPRTGSAGWSSCWCCCGGSWSCRRGGWKGARALGCRAGHVGAESCARKMAVVVEVQVEPVVREEVGPTC